MRQSVLPTLVLLVIVPMGCGPEGDESSHPESSNSENDASSPPSEEPAKNPAEEVPSETSSDPPTSDPVEPSPPSGSNADSASSTPTPLYDGFSLPLLFTGDVIGYLEPCGCSGGLLGGLPRRQTVLDGYRGLPRVLVSNGALVHGNEPVEKVKALTLFRSVEAMGYDAVNLSRLELSLGRDVLLPALEAAPIPVVATNLMDMGDPPLPVRKTVVVDRGDRRTLILGLMDLQEQSMLSDADPDVFLDDPINAAKREMEAAGDVDHVVVLLRGDAAAADRLSEALPQVDLIVFPGGGDDEPARFEVEGSPTVLVSTGQKGKFLPLVSLARDDSLPSDVVDFQIQPLQDAIPDAPIIREILEGHQERLQETNVLAEYLEQREIPGGLSYIGSEACGQCHQDAYKVWSETPDSHGKPGPHKAAWETLVRENRTADPDCVYCHVTGYGYIGGFKSFEETPAQSIVSCEECHGPGSQHIADVTAPYKNSTPDTCMRCHVPDHSPEFDYDTYWERMRHGK